MDCNNYKLFFKILNNKFLYDKIYGYVNTQSYGCYKYDQINHVEWMIVNKHYSLLKDKIKNKEMNLIFYIQESSFSEHINHLIISQSFSNLQKNKERDYKILYENSIFKTNKEFNKQFYNLIFKNYFNQIFLIDDKNINIQDEEEGIEILKNKLILNDNLEAFESLIETFNLKNKIKIDSLKLSLENKSFKISKYLYSLLNSTTQDIVINNQSNIWKDVIKNVYNNIYNKSSGIIINEIIQFLIKEFKFTPPSILSSSRSKYSILKLFSFNNFEFKIDFPIYKESLQVLIDSCKSIIRLGLSNLTESQFKKRKIEKYDQLSDEIIRIYLMEPIEMLTIENLNNIENQFTNEQLSTPLYKLSSTSSNDNEKLIKSLIAMILPFFEDKTLFSNYLFYFIMYKFENGIGGKDIRNGKTQEERDNCTLACYIDGLKQNSNRGNYIDSFFLGEYCSSKIKRQMKFMDFNYLHRRFNLTNILKVMVSQYTDIKLLEYIKQTVLSNNEIKLLQPQDQYIELIKSLPPKISNDHHSNYKNNILFDYLYSNFKINHSPTESTTTSFSINILFPYRISLLKHLKLNYLNDYNQLIGDVDFKLYQDQLLCPKKPIFSKPAIQFINDNINDFSNKLLLPLLNLKDNDITIEFLKSIIFNPSNLELLLTIGFKKSIHLFKYYYYNKIDFDTYFKENYQILFEEVSIKGDLNLFDLILNTNNTNNTNIEFISQILISSAFYGQLIIFKHIENNFENILNLYYSHQPNNNLFKTLIQISYDSKNFHIYNFLKNYL